MLTRDEVRAILAGMRGVPGLCAALLYGAGLRLMECLELRVKDLDFTRGEIVVRDGKRGKDRVTMLPRGAKDRLLAHLKSVRQLHQQDLTEGAGTVALPDALARKYPNAAREWGWQWVFPASSRHVDKDLRIQRRHHLHESVVQKGMKEAVRHCGTPKSATCHSLRGTCAGYVSAKYASPRDRVPKVYS